MMGPWGGQPPQPGAGATNSQDRRLRWGGGGILSVGSLGHGELQTCGVTSRKQTGQESTLQESPEDTP